MLYILILENKKGFKVGITNRHDVNRTKILSRVYKFNFNESYIVDTTDFKTSKVLEKQLHSDYEKYRHFTESKSDGHSEFIKYEKLNDVIDDIKYKTKLTHLGIKIYNFNEFIDSKTLSDKVKLGLDNARQNGRFGGRPKINDSKINEIRALKSSGMNISSISKELNVSRGTIYSYLS